MAVIELIATSAFGLEAVVSRELKQLGYTSQTIENGRVTFTADEAAICRANLWLRSAERLQLKMGEFTARDFGELFDQTRALPWNEWLTEDAAFPVRGKSVQSQLHSVPDCQAIVKKAIVERMRESVNRQWFEETGPAYGVEVSLLKDRVTLALDTSGRGLHKRGYRTLMGPAPLKETLAAGLLQLSFWNAERPLIDPFCGTGTIPIEAAMIGRNRAPGMGRSFAAEKWPRLPQELWDEARKEARDLATGELSFPLIGTDRDEAVIGLAQQHAQNAGVAVDVRWEQRAFQDFTTSDPYGCVVANPPYGERSGQLRDAQDLCREMGRILRPLETWSVYILTSCPDLERLYGCRANRRRKLYNGRIECTYYQFHGLRPPRKPPTG
jgi:putative N6-adenine-specific DNA methylase